MVRSLLFCRRGTLCPRRRFVWFVERRLLLLLFCALPGGCHSQDAKNQPDIDFSKVPPAAQGGRERVGTIAGRVTGARAGEQIVIYAKSGPWWVQPWPDQAFIPIHADSTWRTTTHLGYQYAALLVEPGYHPPPTMDEAATQGGAVTLVGIVVPGNVAQSREPAGTVTDTMVRDPERATFRTVLRVSPNGDAPVVSQHVFTSGIPTPGREFLEFTLSIVTSDKNPPEKGTAGFDPGWREPIRTRQVAYANLDSGKYRFRMMASNSDGLWNSEELSLPIEVEPVFWKRWWFRAFSVVVVVLALMTYLRLRVQRMAKQMDMRFEERLAERTRIARELHDSLLQGFQGLMFRLQAVRDMLPERPNEAAQALESTLDRGDEIIAEGRSTLEDLRDSSLREGDIVQALTNVGEELAHICNGKAVGMRVLVEGKPREFDPMLRDEIYQIGREAMRNAFQHAQAQKIETEVTYGDSEFSLRVRDDGNGIDPEVFQEGRREGHWGLPGMRERATRLGGQLHVWTESGAGTEIELTVPGSVVYVGPASRSKFWFLKSNLRGPYGRRS
jgi:signal transduction histidine kinase